MGCTYSNYPPTPTLHRWFAGSCGSLRHSCYLPGPPREQALRSPHSRGHPGTQRGPAKVQRTHFHGAKTHRSPWRLCQQPVVVVTMLSWPWGHEVGRSESSSLPRLSVAHRGSLLLPCCEGQEAAGVTVPFLGGSGLRSLSWASSLPGRGRCAPAPLQGKPISVLITSDREPWLLFLQRGLGGL